MKRRVPLNRRHQSGVGLIEVLIAVLVLSIGFLGIAALEVMSLSTNNSAMARSMATINTFSILDGMRADLANAKAGSYNTTVTANNCSNGGGTLASLQLYNWCNSLGATLGAKSTTTGKIACDSVGNCAITVTFDDTRSGSNTGGSSTQTFATEAVL